jgi:hypothetical protein
MEDNRFLKVYKEYKEESRQNCSAQMQFKQMDTSRFDCLRDRSKSFNEPNRFSCLVDDSYHTQNTHKTYHKRHNNHTMQPHVKESVNEMARRYREERKEIEEKNKEIERTRFSFESEYHFPELGRATNELGRATNELGRATNELGKATNELGKATNELGKATNEPLQALEYLKTPEPIKATVKLRTQSLDDFKLSSVNPKGMIATMITTTSIIPIKKDDIVTLSLKSGKIVEPYNDTDVNKVLVKKNVYNSWASVIKSEGNQVVYEQTVTEKN